MDEALHREIEENFDFFQRNLSQWLVTEADRYALLRHQTAVRFFDRPEVADRYGQSLFPDGLFSIQRVIADPVELGLFSDAAH
jgi:hypothetical protein